MSRRKLKKRKRKKNTRPGVIELGLDDLRAIINRTESEPLGATEREQLIAAVETLAFITQELEEAGMTIARLRNLLFGPTSEKTKDVLGKPEEDQTDDDPEAEDETAADDEAVDPGDGSAGGKAEDQNDKKPKGHGRNGADAYTGAEKVCVAHGSLKHGDRCPECLKGKVYRQPEPAKLVRVRGVAPLDATVYELERLRCNLCGEVFTAPAPPEVGDKKYDETSAAMASS